jgi:hypothetical protein
MFNFSFESLTAVYVEVLTFFIHCSCHLQVE